MPIDLRGRPIAITGASSGIGAATALACAAAGMPVALGARRLDRLESLAEQIRARGGVALAVACDVTNPNDGARLVARARETFGSLYAVYANAGYGVEGPVELTSDADFRAILETNFYGTLNTIRPALPVLRANPGPHRGHVLICSSCLAKLPIPYYSAYGASKAAQSHLGRAMDLELRGEGIRASTVHPIGTRTEFRATLRGTGNIGAAHTPDGLMQDPALVARETVACLRRPRPEVWTGFRGRLIRVAMAAAVACPGIETPILRRMVKPRPGAGAR
ncbi:MAG TPA: SDR family NAD(P)-dependent oxidoreductase [Phycisphaerales bacterium]|nr:SDR family NAD(P)-dependent oxidoreductase [Phycisphaerales bacterium]